MKNYSHCLSAKKTTNVSRLASLHFVPVSLTHLWFLTLFIGVHITQLEIKQQPRSHPKRGRGSGFIGGDSGRGEITFSEWSPRICHTFGHGIQYTYSSRLSDALSARYYAFLSDILAGYLTCILTCDAPFYPTCYLSYVLTFIHVAFYLAYICVCTYIYIYNIYI